MPNPTLHSPTASALVDTRVSSITPKGRLTVQLSRLQDLVDGLTESEQRDLLAELEPIVRVVRSRASIAAECSPLDDRIAV